MFDLTAFLIASAVSTLIQVLTIGANPSTLPPVVVEQHCTLADPSGDLTCARD